MFSFRNCPFFAFSLPKVFRWFFSSLWFKEIWIVCSFLIKEYHFRSKPSKNARRKRNYFNTSKHETRFNSIQAITENEENSFFMLIFCGTPSKTQKTLAENEIISTRQNTKLVLILYKRSMGTNQYHWQHYQQTNQHVKSVFHKSRILNLISILQWN